MDYKEKYNKALRKALDLYNQGLINPPLEHIFPELKEKENEDERIRKAIIHILKGETGYTSKEDTDKYVAWLKKQGEKKPIFIVKVGGALKNYERGYEDAIDKACEWLLEWETHQGEDIEVVEQFRKAMKGQ